MGGSASAVVCYGNFREFVSAFGGAKDGCVLWTNNTPFFSSPLLGGRLCHGGCEIPEISRSQTEGAPECLGDQASGVLATRVVLRIGREGWRRVATGEDLSQNLKVAGDPSQQYFGDRSIISLTRDFCPFSQFCRPSLRISLGTLETRALNLRLDSSLIDAHFESDSCSTSSWGHICISSRKVDYCQVPKTTFPGASFRFASHLNGFRKPLPPLPLFVINSDSHVPSRLKTEAWGFRRVDD